MQVKRGRLPLPQLQVEIAEGLEVVGSCRKIGKENFLASSLDRWKPVNGLYKDTFNSKSCGKGASSRLSKKLRRILIVKISLHYAGIIQFIENQSLTLVGQLRCFVLVLDRLILDKMLSLTELGRQLLLRMKRHFWYNTCFDVAHMIVSSKEIMKNKTFRIISNKKKTRIINSSN